jgi:MFS transporter, DHA2 family, multidrug resistance protein
MYFGSVVIIPLWLQSNMGYNSIWAGIAVAPIGIVPMLFSLWIAKLISRFESIPLLGVGFILFALSCFYTSYLDTDVSLFVVGLSRLFFGCGLYFFISPLFALSFADIPIEKMPSAAGLFHFVRTMVGGFGTSIFTTLWIRRTAYHHATVGENLTQFSPMTKNLFEQLSDIGLVGKKGLAQADLILSNQAAVLAINDCFWVMGWAFLALLVFLPFGYKKRPLA